MIDQKKVEKEVKALASPTGAPKRKSEGEG